MRSRGIGRLDMLATQTTQENEAMPQPPDATIIGRKRLQIETKIIGHDDCWCLPCPSFWAKYHLCKTIICQDRRTACRLHVFENESRASSDGVSGIDSSA